MPNPLIGVTAIVAALLISTPVLAQQATGAQEHQIDMMQRHHRQMMQMTSKRDQREEKTPTRAGQEAFGTIQEIVHILETDPNTNWSKVTLETLRQHLIDMNEITLNADVRTKSINGGIEATVIGSGRTFEAIQRMVPAHARQIDQTHMNGWSAKSTPVPNGVALTVTSADPQEVQRLIGFMVSGSHHQGHHLAMARGEPIHAH